MTNRTLTRTLAAATLAASLSFTAIGTANAGPFYGFMSFMSFMSLSGTDLGSGR